MSPQIPALPLVKVIDAKVSDQDKSLLTLVESASGQRFWLSLPVSEVPLLAHAAGLASASERDEQLRHHALKALNASWVEFLAIPEEPEALAMSVTFGSGAILTFRLPKPMPRTMLETLQVALLTDKSQAPRNSTPLLRDDLVTHGAVTSHYYEQ